MTEPTADPVPSLIQQRMALQRRRNYAMYTLVSSTVLAALWVGILVVDGNELWRWLGAVAFGASMVVGFVELVRARKDTRDFEDRNGPDAGVQKSIR
jgi:hypothetical protein